MDVTVPNEALTVPPFTVLPFRNSSGSPEQDFLTNGIDGTPVRAF